MRAALQHPGRGRAARRAAGGRSWAVLGPMAELGDDAPRRARRGRPRSPPGWASRTCWRSATRPARSEHGAALEGSWDGEARWVPDVDAAIALLRAELRPGDVVLVKASRSAGLERVAAGASREDAGRTTGRRPERGRGRHRVKTILVAAIVSLMTSILVHARWSSCGSAAAASARRSAWTARRPTWSSAARPTMGGVAIVGSTVVGYAVAHVIRRDPRRRRPARPPGCWPLFLMVGLGVGRLPRRLHQDPAPAQPRPARPRQVRRPAARRAWCSPCWRCSSATGFGLTPASTHLSYVRDIAAIGARRRSASSSLAYLIISATSNAVNLTDGLDGLAAGAAAMVFGAFTLISFLQSRNQCLQPPGRRLLHRARPARPRDRRGVGDGRVLRVPVVERLARADLHGRHRLAGPRRADGRAGDPDPHRAAARRARRAVRRDHASRRSSRPAGSRSPEYAPARADVSSGWPRCTTTSSSPGGSRSRSSCGSGSWPGMAVAFGMGLFYADFIGNG